MNKKIKELVLENENEMIETRRDFHRYPELSMEEYETSKKVAAQLEEWGVPYKMTEPTGVIAEIKGKEGKTVALRADMDALSVQELYDRGYKSTFEGKMHACGHDTHTAMLLTATKVLWQLRDELNGNVRLIFQPAEEIGKGARLMVDQGAMDGVDNAFGIHIASYLPTGIIACAAGPSFAATDRFEVRFKGRGGHAAQPDLCVDAAVIVSQYVSNVQAIVSREIDPLQPAVVTIGKIEAGTRFNVIAENAIIEGTVRTFDNSTRDTIEETLEKYANGLAQMYGAEVEFIYDRITEVVDNDLSSANLAKEVVKECFGEKAYYPAPKLMGGEDFGYYMIDTKGVFVLVGSKNDAKDTGWAHHHGKFDIDEDALKFGAELYAQYAISYLNQDKF